MIVYYAHCIHIYKTAQEARDLATLSAMGCSVLNPSDDAYDNLAKTIRQVWHDHHDHIAVDRLSNAEELTMIAPYLNDNDTGRAVMELVFKPLVRNADLVAFRSLPDGRISAGVAKELAWAQEAQKPVFELPNLLASRIMTVNETREYLTLVGQR